MFDVGEMIDGMELPEPFFRLAELLEQDQFELLLPEASTEEETHKKKDISLVYLMNDAVESFLVFHNATMTGQYQNGYEGELLAVLDKKETEYVLVVHQGDSVVTLFFEDLFQKNNLYNYGKLGHFWVSGYEYIRLLEYRLAILRDKCDYLDESCSTPEEKRLAALVEFPPLNYCCYPAVPEKYIVPRENPWKPSEEAIDVMEELAVEAGDRSFLRILSYYRKNNAKIVARLIAMLLHKKRHIKIIRILTQRLQKAATIYPKRSFGKENDPVIKQRLEKAKQRQETLRKEGIYAEIIREEPFVEAKDSVQYNIYLMKWKQKRGNCIIEIEELYHRYYRELYIFIFSLCKSETVTDDILQDTFLKALLSLKDSHTNMRAWLYMVARNLYYNYYNKQKNLLSIETEDLDQSVAAVLVAKSNALVQKDILEEILQKEEKKKLWKAVNRLKGQKKEVIMLQYFGDFSVKEIAAMLKLTPGNVKVLSYRAKKELKVYLRKSEEENK